MNKTINQYINQLHLDPKREAAVRKLVQSVSQSSGGSNGGNSGGSNTPEPEFVDLGLPSGTLWCSCNLGANSPEEYGNLYQWGGDTPFTIESIENRLVFKDKDGNIIENIHAYFPKNYKYQVYSEDDNFMFYSKYHWNRDYFVKNKPLDYKWILDDSDDVTKKYNPNWSIPTARQIQELVDYCDNTVTEDKVIFVSKINNNSIIVPRIPELSYMLWSNELDCYPYYQSDETGGPITLMVNIFGNEVQCSGRESYGRSDRALAIGVRPVINSNPNSSLQIVKIRYYKYSNVRADALCFSQICYAIRNDLPIAYPLSGKCIDVSQVIINETNFDIESFEVYDPYAEKTFKINKNLSIESID